MLLETFRGQRVELAERIYVLLVSLFIGLLLLTNIVTSKYICLGPFLMTAGAFVYPFTFLLVDVITERYGKKRAQLLIWMGLMTNIFMTLVTYLADRIPIYSGSPVSQRVFSLIFAFTPGIVLGSMVAYLVGQFMDIYLFDLARQLTQGKYLWIRNVCSTLIGQFLDTVIFGLMAWILWPRLGASAGLTIIHWDTWYQITLHEYGFKVLFTFLNVPLVYGARFGIKWAEKRFG